MQNRILLLASLALPCSTWAMFDQIEPLGSLETDLEYGVAQVFPDLPEFSGMVIDDFFAGGKITRVSAAFELIDPASFSTLPGLVQGWRISVFESVAKAEQAGNEFALNTLATHVVTAPTYSSLGSVGKTTGFRVDFDGLNLDSGVGLRWIGVAAIMPSTTLEQVFLLGNSQPASFGGGAADNALFVNPGEAFGTWRSQALNTNAAYRVEAVPEPATLAGLALGASWLTRRRKR